MEVTVIVTGSYAESCALSAMSDSKLFRSLRMVPWVYPFSTQCQYHYAEGQWQTLVRIDFASLLDTITIYVSCSLYQRDLKDWEYTLIMDQTWINLRPLIQEAYQRRLTTDTIMAAQGGYTQNNQFSGLTTNEEFGNDITNTIASTINLHMAKLFKMGCGQVMLLRLKRRWGHWGCDGRLIFFV
jgi:hypothetical protein